MQPYLTLPLGASFSLFYSTSVFSFSILARALWHMIASKAFSLTDAHKGLPVSSPPFGDGLMAIATFSVLRANPTFLSILYELFISARPEFAFLFSSPSTAENSSNFGPFFSFPEDDDVLLSLLTVEVYPLDGRLLMLGGLHVFFVALALFVGLPSSFSSLSSVLPQQILPQTRCEDRCF